MDDHEQKWVSNLVIIRHGESVRNEARARAQAEGLETYGEDGPRDMDVPLTETGRRQAIVTGERLRGMLGFDFDRVFVSPYQRTKETAELVTRGLQHSVNPSLDERVREKEFGALDGLTRRGVEKRYPDEARRRARDGKYYYRPIGGESYPDVNMRVHDFLGMLIRECRSQNVLVVCHSVIVLSFRLLLERLDEQKLLAIDEDKTQEPRNCGVTWFAFDRTQGPRGRLALKEYNRTLYGPELATDEASRTSAMP